MVTAKKTVKTKVLSDEDKILGKSAETEISIDVNYESPSRKYKITNLVVKNNPIIITGDVVEAFIGTNNLTQRKELKQGAKQVITKDANGNDMHKIEVVDG